MAAWTLKHGATTQALEDWGFELATRDRLSLVPDTVRLQAVGDYLEDPVFPYKDIVKIFKDGLPWFEGRSVRALRQAFGGSEIIGYEIAGPVWDLDNLPYQQVWKTYVSDGGDPPAPIIATYDSPTATLMQDDAGAPITTGAQIAEVIDYAIARGANLQKGTIYTGVYAAQTQVVDQMCGDVLRQLVAMRPDVIGRIDYSTSPPTIHIRKLSEFTPQALDLSATLPDDINLTEREDTRPSYVRVQYRRTDQIESAEGGTDTKLKLEDDVWPVDEHIAPGVDHIGALVTTADLTGGSLRTHNQRVKTLVIPESEDGASTAPGGNPFSRDVNWWTDMKAFWTYHFPWLAEITNGSIGVAKGSHIVTSIVAGESFPDVGGAPDPDPEYDPHEIRRQLLDGQIAEWMDEKVGTVKVTCKLGFWGADLKGNRIKKLFPEIGTIGDEAGGAGKPARFRTLEVKVPATSARTRNYKNTEALVAPETMPVGVAKEMYEALDALQLEGSFSLVAEEPPAVDLGAANLAGLKAAWAALPIMVQGVSEDIQNGTTNVRIGAPQHRGIQDLIEHQRFMRRNPVKFGTPEERTEGEVGSSQDSITHPYSPPAADSASPDNFLHEFALSIAPVDLQADPVVYEGFIEPGFITTNLNTDGTLNHLMPEIDGTEIDTEPAPKLDLGSSGEQKVWFEHTVEAGVVTKVEAKSGTTVPDDIEDELIVRELGKADLDAAAPEAENTEITGGYHVGMPEDLGDNPNATELTFYLPTPGTVSDSDPCVEISYQEYTAKFIDLVASEDDPIVLDLQKCFDPTVSERTKSFNLSKVSFHPISASDPDGCKTIRIEPKKITVPSNAKIEADGDNEQHAFKLCDDQPNDPPPEQIEVIAGTAAGSGDGDTEAAEILGVYTKQENGTYERDTGDPASLVHNEGASPHSWDLGENGWVGDIFYAEREDVLGIYYFDDDVNNASVEVVEYTPP